MISFLLLSGVNSTCWRGNAAPGWRSWRLWLESTCRTGSPSQTSWRKQRPSSRWEKPCCHTTATPNIHGTSCACFPTQRKTWLHCAVKDRTRREKLTLRNQWKCLETRYSSLLIWELTDLSETSCFVSVIYVGFNRGRTFSVLEEVADREEESAAKFLKNVMLLLLGCIFVRVVDHRRWSWSANYAGNSCWL